MNQDVDAPLPKPIVHGLYYALAPSTPSLLVPPAVLTSDSQLPSGTKIGMNRRGNVYMPPRPLKGHGEHRYFYQVIALRRKLNLEEKNGKKVTLEQILEVLKKEDIAAWGEWVGVAERKPS